MTWLGRVLSGRAREAVPERFTQLRGWVRQWAHPLRLLRCRTGCRKVAGVDYTITATDARASLYNLLTEANASHRPATITGKNGNAVLVSEQDWNAIMETVALHAVPGLVDEIRSGRQEPIDTMPLAW